MTYIGQQPATTFDAGIQDRFTGLSTNTVTLTHEIAAEEDILVVWNNIVQDKNTYSVGGTGNKTLTLGGTLVSADVVTVYYLNKVMQSVNPTAGSVGITELNVSDGSNGQALTTNGSGTLSFSTIAGFDVSSITGATAIGAIPANDDEFVMSDGGTLKRIDYKYLVPYGSLAGNFSHGNQTGISSFSYTKILLSSENYNRGLTFGSNKITIPTGGAGDYMVSVTMAVNLYGSDKMQAAKAAIYINGSGSKYFGNDFRDNPGRDATIVYNDIIQFNDSDEIEIYAYIGHTQSTSSYQAANSTSVTLFKVNNA